MRSWVVLIVLLVSFSAPARAQERPWLVGADGGLYVDAGKGLKRVGRQKAISLAVHSKTLYLIAPDSRVLSSDLKATNWQPLAAGKGLKVLVDSRGDVYILGLDGGVYQLVKNEWRSIGPANGHDLAVGGPEQLFTALQGAVLEKTPRTDWSARNPLAVARKLGASEDGTLYTVGRDDQLYRVSRIKIEPLRGPPQPPRELCVSARGQLAIIGADQGVYLFNGGKWKRMGDGKARQVAWPR